MSDQKYSLGGHEAEATINAPIEGVDLGDWMFSITSEEYARCAQGHQAAA